MKIISMNYKTLFLVILFSLLQFSILVAQNKRDSTDSPHSLGISWNTASLFKNYPAFQLSAQYIWKKKIAVEIGAGTIFDSEIFLFSESNITHKNGFVLLGEIKYFFNLTKYGSGPYLGVGYSHLESTFQAKYIARITDQGDRYFRNVDQEYYSNINQYYLKMGYYIITKNKRLFFEMGINIGFVQKDITPEPSDFGGVLVTNKSFVNDIYKFPLPFSSDLKIGIMLF